MNEKWQNVDHLQQQIIFWRWWVIAFQDAALRDFEVFSKMERRVAELEAQREIYFLRG